MYTFIHTRLLLFLGNNTFSSCVLSWNTSTLYCNKAFSPTKCRVQVYNNQPLYIIISGNDCAYNVIWLHNIYLAIYVHHHIHVNTINDKCYQQEIKKCLFSASNIPPFIEVFYLETTFSMTVFLMGHYFVDTAFKQLKVVI